MDSDNFATLDLSCFEDCEDLMALLQPAPERDFGASSQAMDRALVDAERLPNTTTHGMCIIS